MPSLNFLCWARLARFGVPRSRRGGRPAGAGGRIPAFTESGRTSDSWTRLHLGYARRDLNVKGKFDVNFKVRRSFPSGSCSTARRKGRVGGVRGELGRSQGARGSRHRGQGRSTPKPQLLPTPANSCSLCIFRSNPTRPDPRKEECGCVLILDMTDPGNSRRRGVVRRRSSQPREPALAAARWRTAARVRWPSLRDGASS